MTKTLVHSIEETYRKVFGDDIKQPDFKRIEFLESIANDLVSVGKEFLTLDEAVKLVDQKLEEEEKKPKNQQSVSKQAQYTQQLKEYQAMQDLRNNWYLQSEKSNIQNSKQNIVQGLLEANMEYILNTLEDCMKVLQKHRIETLLEPFYKAFKTKNGKLDTAVRTAAQKLLALNVTEIEDKVVNRMAEYHAELKDSLDKALESGDDNLINNAAQTLRKTEVPGLQAYAQQKLAAYQKRG
jgi:hypothetical protein